MRKPHQILVFPYKIVDKDTILYGIFSRADGKEVWQGVAGGVEGNETYIEACRREANEEAGISLDANVIELDSISTMPVVNVVKDFMWGEDVLLIYEHCFGIDATNEEIKISLEHKEMKWVSYDEACNKLKWDSNRNALWELNIKLTRMIDKENN